MDKKDCIAKIFDSALPDGLLAKIKSVFTNELIVLAYHRICDISEKYYKFDMELVSANSKEFEFQVSYIKKHYNPIGINRLVQYFENNEELPERSVLITFDDGFDDNYHNAFPILEKYNVPATIFVSTGYVSTENIIWFNKLAAIVFSIDDDVLELNQINKSYQLGINKSSRGKIMEEICEDLKIIPNEKREIIMTQLQNTYSNVCADIDVSQSKMLTWEQIKKMNNSVVSIGSHTVSHPILTKLNETDLEHELLDSKEILEKKLDVEINTISYPNGNADAYNQKVIEKLIHVGYKLAFTYESGVNRIPIKNRYSLKRLHAEHYVSRHKFKYMLCLPTIFSDKD